ncbi:MAG: ABC transporter substrate-binding protein, partial [Fusobacteriaceae bacterium]
MKEKIKKIALAITILGVAACGEKEKSTAKTPVNKDDVTLRVSWWGGDERHNLTLEAIKAFETKNPGIKIVPEYSGWQGHVEKITTQIVGNTAPDVMQVNWDWLFTFSKNGDGFYDLSKMKDILQVENYPEELLSATTINGKLNAIPQGVTGKVFYFNETMYEKAGLKLPTSFEEIKNSAKVLKEKLGAGNYAMDLDQYAAFLLILYKLEQETGKGFITGDQVSYSVDELENGFKFYTDLVKDGVVPSMALRAGAGNVPLDQHPSWIKGEYDGTYEWDSAAQKWQDSLEKPMKLAVGEFPKDFGPHKSAFNKISMAFTI